MRLGQRVKEIRNPKVEIRNVRIGVGSDLKALVSPRNTRPTEEVARLDHPRRLGFRVSDFFRASDFGFRILRRTGRGFHWK